MYQTICTSVIIVDIAQHETDCKYWATRSNCHAQTSKVSRCMTPRLPQFLTYVMVETVAIVVLVFLACIIPQTPSMTLCDEHAPETLVDKMKMVG